MPPALPVVRVQSDRRNAGKTWLASALIEELTRRGYRVGAVKQSHHVLPPDKPGSDTELFAGAGAVRVMFAASRGVFERTPREATLIQVLDRMAGEVDVAIVEGFKEGELGARLFVDADAETATLTSMDQRELITSDRCDADAFVDAIEREFELTAEGNEALRRLIRLGAEAHGHACPGVTLGVRMALAAARSLDIPLPAAHRKLDVVVETARCASDAIAAATGCSLGRGNLHLDERGKMAARFRDVGSGREVRVAVREESRGLAARWAPVGTSSRHAQSIAYRVMEDELLLELEVLGTAFASSVCAKGGKAGARCEADSLVIEESSVRDAGGN